MQLKKLMPFLVASFFFLTGLNWSDGARQYLELKGPTGGGEVEVDPMQSRATPRLRNLAVTVYGLQPNSVYSVWYENEKGERSPAGVDTNHFKTDPGGKGRYVTSVFGDVLDQWRYLEVMLHPDGNPKNTAGMTPALKGDLVYGTHS
jgi:hypothetical protein